MKKIYAIVFIIFGSIASVYAQPVPACANMATALPANGTLNMPAKSTTLYWDAVPDATEYDVYLSASDIPPYTFVGTASTNNFLAPVLSYSTDYYWFVVPKSLSGVANGCGFVSNTFKTEDAPVPPTNNELLSAIALTDNTPVANTTIGATESMPSISCNGMPGNIPAATANDVWFSFVPTNGTMFGNNSFAEFDLTNLSPELKVVIQVYQVNGMGYTSVDCITANNSGENTTLYVMDLNQNETYYVRVYGYASEGNFTITLNPSFFVKATTPVITANNNPICPGNAVTLQIASGNLNSADDWKWYSTSCSGTLIGTGTSITVSPTTSTTYYARGEGTFTSPGDCGSITINTNGTTITWYRDADGDGWGTPRNTVTSCVQPLGYVLNDKDSADHIVNNANWKIVGDSALFMTDTALYLGEAPVSYDITSDTASVVHVAYIRFGGQMFVRKFVNNAWHDLGNPNVGLGSNPNHIKIAVANDGSIYISYFCDQLSGAGSPDIYVLKYDGIAWAPVNALSIDAGTIIKESSLAVAPDGFPVVFYSVSDGSLRIKKLGINSLSGFLMSSIKGKNLSITVSNSEYIYIAFSDLNNAGKATVMSFNGTNWFGGGLNSVVSTSSASSINIVVDAAENIYISYLEVNNSFKKGYVKRLINGEWNAVFVADSAAKMNIQKDEANNIWIQHEKIRPSNLLLSLVKYNPYSGLTNLPIGSTNISNDFASQFFGNSILAVTRKAIPYIIYYDQYQRVAGTKILYLEHDLTWKGLSTNWNATNNWYDNKIPKTNDDVLIAPALNMPLITDTTITYNACRLTIAKNAFVRVDNNAKLNIYRLLDVKGQFDATNGTLIIPRKTISGFASDNYQYPVVDLFATKDSCKIGTLKSSDKTTLYINSKINIFKELSIGGIIAAIGDSVITLKSSATGTAIVSKVSGALWGYNNVIVEHFIPARRAFRFLSFGVNSSKSIHDNWQEGATNYLNNPNSGYGTHITGSINGNNGFDQSISGNPSLFTFNSTLQNWQAASNTTAVSTSFTTSSPLRAYRILIRGDRSINLNDPTNAPTPTNTILRAVGTLNSSFVNYKGLPYFTNVIGSYALIANPFWCPVNWETILENIKTTNISPTYTVWDPTRTGTNNRGAYVTYNALTHTSNDATSEVNKYIQPGQAILVQTTAANPQLEFQEDDKYADGLTHVFRIVPNSTPTISIALHLQDTLAAADAVKVLFNKNFKQEIGNEDANKLTNLDENLAVISNDKTLSIEGRKTINNNDSIQLKLWNLLSKKYTLNCNLENFDNSFSAYLIDNYLKTSTKLLANNKTPYTFTITADTASLSTTRFKIVFKENKPMPVVAAEFTGIKIFPNPASEFIQVTYDFTENTGVNIVDANGKIVQSIKASKSKSLTIPVQHLSNGIYLIQIVKGKEILSVKFIKQ